ncbi:MAG: glycosyltransferase family 4 protein [Gemmatimonadales bacterium]
MPPTVMQVLHQGGGAGSVTSTLHLSLGLQRAGIQVRFVCPPGSEVEALARSRGLEVHPLSLRAGELGRNSARLEALLQRQPVDLVNSQSSRDRQALVWLALRGRLSSPLVVTRRQMPRTFALANRLVGRMATRVIAVSQAVAEAMRRKGTPADKLVVIPNGLVAERVDVPVSESALQAWGERLGWAAGRRTIGIVARRKDQPVVLRALEMVATPVRLVLAGVDPSDKMAKLAGRVPPRHAVVFLPFTADVRPLYELLELVLLPSRIEGLSQALLEAMALGRPVIASAAAGNLDLVTDGVDGRLVRPLDPRAWAAAIEQLLAEPGLARRLGEAGRDTARNRFSLERTVERTIAVYQEVLELSRR